LADLRVQLVQLRFIGYLGRLPAPEKVADTPSIACRFHDAIIV
jgi:hypothetical protein